MLIAPGTKWCGHKRLASGYVDLGGLSNLDRCCRRHDLCPHSISGFSTKYYLFNYRLFSVSHCHCDRRYE
jgi:secretory phospholipase A2